MQSKSFNIHKVPSDLLQTLDPHLHTLNLSGNTLSLHEHGVIRREVQVHTSSLKGACDTQPTVTIDRIKEIGSKTRKILEAEIGKRKEIRQLDDDDENDLIERQLEFSRKRQRTAKQGKNSETGRTVTEPKESQDENSINDKGSKFVRVWVPKGVNRDDIMQFFRGLDPVSVLVLTPFPDKSVRLHCLTDSSEELQRAIKKKKGHIIDREDFTLRILVEFKSKSAGKLAVERSGENVKIKDLGGCEQAVPIFVTLLPVRVTKLIVKQHMYTVARKGQNLSETFHDSESNSITLLTSLILWINLLKEGDEPKLEGIIPSKIWVELAEWVMYAESRPDICDKSVYEAVARKHNIFVKFYEFLSIVSSRRNVELLSRSKRQEGIAKDWIRRQCDLMLSLLKNYRQYDKLPALIDYDEDDDHKDDDMSFTLE